MNIDKEKRLIDELEEERKAHLKSMLCEKFCKFPDLYSMTYGDDRQDRMHNEVCDVCPLTQL